MSNRLAFLKEWTGKSTATILYDSNNDEFTDDGLFESIRGKPGVAIVACTTTGDVFGGFYSVAVAKRNCPVRDPGIFVFSFGLRGRCVPPQRFLPKREAVGSLSVKFCKHSPYRWFVRFDGVVGWFHLGNEHSHTYCHNLADILEGVEETTLTQRRDSTNHCCSRLVAVQLA